MARGHFREAGDLLRSAGILQLGHGKHVREVLANGWQVHEGTGCWSSGFAPFIAGFFGRCSPLVRREKG